VAAWNVRPMPCQVHQRRPPPYDPIVARCTRSPSGQPHAEARAWRPLACRQTIRQLGTRQDLAPSQVHFGFLRLRRPDHPSDVAGETARCSAGSPPPIGHPKPTGQPWLASREPLIKPVHGLDQEQNKSAVLFCSQIQWLAPSNLAAHPCAALGKLLVRASLGITRPERGRRGHPRERIR